jgi:hypothetical protein
MEKNEIPYFLEKRLLMDQGNEQSSLSQLRYKYSPVPRTIFIAEEKNKNTTEGHRKPTKTKKMK